MKTKLLKKLRKRIKILYYAEVDQFVVINLFDDHEPKVYKTQRGARNFRRESILKNARDFYKDIPRNKE